VESGATLRHPPCGCQGNPRLPRARRAHGRSARDVVMRAGRGRGRRLRSSGPGCAGVPAQRRCAGGPAAIPAGRYRPGARATRHLLRAGRPSPWAGAIVRWGFLQARSARSRARAIMQACRSRACRTAAVAV